MFSLYKGYGLFFAATQVAKLCLFEVDVKPGQDEYNLHRTEFK